MHAAKSCILNKISSLWARSCFRCSHKDQLVLGAQLVRARARIPSRHGALCVHNLKGIKEQSRTLVSCMCSKAEVWKE